MIRSTCENALQVIRKAEKEFSLDPEQIIEKSYHMTTVLRNLLSTVKKNVLETGFSDENEEINFFKTVKPQILGKLIYYNKVFRIETSCPIVRGKMHHKHFSNELNLLKQEFKEQFYNTDFYRYYRTGRTEWDQHFFCLGKIDIHEGVNSFVFEIDTQFSTYYDYKVSRIIANELLYNYLLSKIEDEKEQTMIFPDGNSSSRDFFWTDSKNALIELIYALHASGSISNGKAGIRKISMAFQMLFKIQLGDVHHAFHRMKDRSDSKSIFLDQLSSSLKQHMDKEM
ncbi:RteC domain-containing protein [Flavobacterium sp. TAB 87]|uniref:RteC domain-containing protein n=1 Tax=Flavobacterium sp. TAB 87 TaxID=1729581 RepID=UPI00076CE101|nr:RteC domain-containing protein [Flavobacterium sp. TAB 87]KVV15016.1 RteC protein [Flavobacterium sp. TAB 87]